MNLTDLCEQHGVREWGFRAPFAVRLLRKVAERGECWEFLGARNSHGYGQICYMGRLAPAHRASYEFFVGTIPAGLHIDHLCRNRACVRPDHLDPVTCRENLLRGQTLTAKNAAKVECPAGHSLTGDNVYSHSGRRHCRACFKRRDQDRRAAKAAA